MAVWMTRSVLVSIELVYESKEALSPEQLQALQTDLHHKLVECSSLDKDDYMVVHVYQPQEVPDLSGRFRDRDFD